MAERRSVGPNYLVALMLVIVAMIAFSISNYGGPQVMTGMASAQVGNLSTRILTYVACTASNDALNVSFGDSNPGEINNATKNFFTPTNTSYNITNDLLSNVAINLTIKGGNLISGVNVIGINNVTWTNGTTTTAAGTYAASVALTTADAVAMTNLARGSSDHFRFWISVPNSQTAGTYTGNYTITCVQYN